MTDKAVRVVLQLDGKQYSAELKTAEQQHRSWSSAVVSATDRTTASVQGLTSQLGRLGQAAAGAFAVQKIASTADAWASLNARVTLASEGIGSAQVAMQGLSRISADARVDLAGLAETYGTLSKAGAELGYSQQRVIGITETLSKAMTLSGGSADAARAAMVQFGQGLQAGTLRGDELNSVLEQAPRLAQALAEGLGQPVGALKSLAEQGQITTEAIFVALERMKGKIDSEFAQLPTTIGQSLTVLQNSFLQTIGVFDQANGVSRGLAEGVLTVARNMDMAVASTAALGAGYLAVTKSAAGAAVATRALSLATGLLGGPIGLVATALGIGASAWLAWKAAGTGSEKAVQQQVTESHGEIIARIDAQIAKLRERNQLAGAPLPKGENQTSLDAAKLYTDAYARYNNIAQGQGEFAGMTAQTRGALLQAAGKAMGEAYQRYTNLSDAMAADAKAKTAKARETFMADYKDQSAKMADALAAYDKEFKGKVSTSQYQHDTAAIRAKFAQANAGAASAAKAALAEDIAGFEEMQAQATAMAARAGKTLDAQHQAGLVSDRNYAEQKRELAAQANADQQALVELEQQAVERSNASAKDKAAARQKYGLELAKLREEDLAAEDAYQAELMRLDAQTAQKRAQLRQAESQGIEQWMAEQDAARRQALTTLEERKQALRDEEEAVRLSAAQNISLAEAIERVAIKRLEEAQAAKFHQGSEGWEAIQKEIDARKELAGLIGGKEAREAAKRTADETSRELQRVTEQYENGLTNAAMQGGKSLKEYITGMLRTTAFRILLQPVMSSLAGVLTSVTSATGGAAGAASNPLGSLGLMSGLMGGGTSAFAMGLSGAWGAGGGLLSTLNAGASLLGSGSIFSGLGVIAGALGPIAMGLSLLSGLIKKSTPHMGALAQYSAEGGLQTSYEHGAFDMGFGGVDANDQTRAAVGTVAKTMVNTLDSLSKRFGGAGGYEVATAFADDSSKDGAWGGLRISAGGKDIINWNEDRDGRWAPREFADGEAGQAEYQAELAKSLRAAILDMPLDAWARDQVEALGDDVSLDALSSAVDTINAASEAFDNLALHIESFAALSEEALSDLVKAAGSPQALASGMTSYLNNYYSEEERAAVVRQQISDKLAAQGLAMPATQEGFRTLVDNAMATLEGSTGDMREEAARAAVELLQLSEAFAAVTDSAEEAAQAQETARRSATDKAYAALQAAVQRERDVAQEALDAAEDRASAGRTLVESLQAEVDDIRGTVASTAGMAAAMGIETVNQALAAVRAGVAPQSLDIDLTDAAAAARGALATGNFRSRTEFEIANLTWANRLEELGDAADKQLTTDEQLVIAAQDQIDGLDALLDQAKMALDVARGTYTGIQDLNTTVRAFYDALTAESGDEAGTGSGAAGTTGGSGGFVIGGGSGSAAAGPSLGPGQRAANGNYLREYYLGTYGSDFHAVSDAEQANLDGLASGLVSQYSGTGDVAGLFSAAREAGFTLSDLATVGGYNYADILARAEAEGIPRFDGGGLHGGGARWVGETAAELEITGPSRILSNRQLGELLRDDSGSASVVAAVMALQTTVYDLVRPLIVNSNKAETLMRKFDALGLGARA